MLKKLLPKAICILIFFIDGFAVAYASGSAQPDLLQLKQLIQKIDYVQKHDRDSAIVLSYDLLNKAEQCSYEHGIWRARLFLANNYFETGGKDSAYQIINNLFSEVEKSDDKNFKIETHLELAWFYQNDFNFEPAISHLLAADRLWQVGDSIAYKFDILKQLGSTHKKMKNYPTALKYYQQIKDNYFPELSNLQKSFILMNEGNVRAMQRKYDVAEELFLESFDLIKNIDSPSDIALITYNLGALYYRLKKYNLAEEYVSRSLDAAIKINQQEDVENCYRVLSMIYSERKDYETAEIYLNKAMNVARKIGKVKAILGNYKNLYNLYWNRGYYTKDIEYLDKALIYYHKYDQLNDSVYQAQATAKILELEEQYEAEKKNNRIALLEKENQSIEAQVKIQRVQRNYLIVVIVLIFGLLGVFVYFYYYYKKINRLLKAQGNRIKYQRDKISQQNEKLQASIDTQHKLHSIIAHDLRSPLASISNLTKLVDIYINDREYDSLEGTVKILEQKNEQILDLTDNLLSWARSQTDGVKPLFEEVDYEETLKDCLKLYYPAAEAKEIDLTYSSYNKVVFWADQNMVKTLFRNLINNAIKFTPKGGAVRVYLKMNGDKAQICVCDSGIGMSKEKANKIFKPDPSKVSSSTEGEKSSGLGLIVCKEFTEAMHGKIWVESEEGKGSCFKIELPLFQPES